MADGRLILSHLLRVSRAAAARGRMRSGYDLVLALCVGIVLIRCTAFLTLAFVQFGGLEIRGYVLAVAAALPALWSLVLVFALMEGSGRADPRLFFLGTPAAARARRLDALAMILLRPVGLLLPAYGLLVVLASADAISALVPILSSALVVGLCATVRGGLRPGRSGSDPADAESGAGVVLAAAYLVPAVPDFVVDAGRLAPVHFLGALGPAWQAGSQAASLLIPLVAPVLALLLGILGRLPRPRVMRRRPLPLARLIAPGDGIAYPVLFLFALGLVAAGSGSLPSVLGLAAVVGALIVALRLSALFVGLRDRWGLVATASRFRRRAIRAGGVVVLVHALAGGAVFALVRVLGGAG